MRSGVEISRRIGAAWVVLIASLWVPFGPGLGAQSPQVANKHRAAFDFSREDVLKHERVTLSAYRGKVVLVNFWATWCASCLTEMPAFDSWQKEYGKRGFQVIGISMDDGVPEVATLVSRLKLRYPVVMGDERLGVAYGGVLGLPVTFLIDRKGTIQARYSDVDMVQMQHQVEGLLKLP